MISRCITIQNNYSFFLFGPRGSGKSTFLRAFFQGKPPPLWVDLLDPDEEAFFQADPGELTRRCRKLPAGAWVVIDEVQKAPRLLDLVHKHIEDQKLFFALTGSSARKLKRGSANLLAGRAFVNHLYPFASGELQSKFELHQSLEWGMLPKIWEFSDTSLKKKFLQAYAHTYLKEEIQSEQIVRNLPGFRRFLDIAAQMNGRPTNYSKIASDIHSDHTVVRTYYDILEDTLVGFRLPAYDISVRKQQRQAAKFYFIDTGIKRALDKTLDIPLRPQTYEFGRAFEHFVILEFYKHCQYREKDETLSYLQTKDSVEVDLIMTRPGRKTLFIEIKSASQVSQADFRSLNRITDGLHDTEALLLSLDPNIKVVEGVTAYPWDVFLQKFLADDVG